MTARQETHKDLFLAEFFSVIVSVGMYVFLTNHMSHEGAILTTCAFLFLTTITSLKKSCGTLAMASFVALFVLFIAGLSGTYLGSGGLKPVIFSAGFGYMSFLALPVLMVHIGLKYRWSAISLFAEGMLVWIGLSHTPSWL